MKAWHFFILLFSLSVPPAMYGQDRRVGGPCEGCEAIHESSLPFEELKETVVLPGATWNGRKPLGINGIVYKADGKTPAPGRDHLHLSYGRERILYGKAGSEGMGEKARIDSEPAHIHITIKEPGLREYYLDEYLFDDDPLLTENYLTKLKNRGGSGVLRLKDVGNMYKAERHIYLGKNIPDYPAE